MATRRYLCPYCNKRIEKEKLVSHLSRTHAKELPELFTGARAAYHIMNKRPLEYSGKCRVCGSPTFWDEKKARYNFLCEKPACQKAWVNKMKSTMGDKMGSNRPTATPEGLAKMLAGRKISGTYKFKDGHEFTYTGSYELEVLKFLDQVLDVKSEDLQAPGPILQYKFQGKNHLYITDFYYLPYNLIIEVKDGGLNPNTNEQFALTRAKQMAKENFIINNTDYNYLRLTDKDLSQLFTVFAELKLNMEEEDNRIVRVHEDAVISERGLDTIIFDFGNVLVYDKDPMVYTKDNLETCYYTDKLLSTLKEKGYKLYYLSNWDEENFNYQKERGVLDFIKYFDGGIVSYQIKEEKPAVSIYKKLIDKYQIDTKTALFLDDKQENIETAREEQLVGIVFDKFFVNILMELPEVDSKEVVSEGKVMNEKDIYYNKAKFDSGEINICFITGLSGSGKSTLANGMEKDGVEKYELDDILANYNFTDDNLKEYGEVISSYFKGPGKKYRIKPDEKEKAEEWTDEDEAGAIRSFISHVMGYAKSHKASKFIVEGVELYWFYKPEELKDYAVYIKGTSALISMIRSARRDCEDAKGLGKAKSFIKNMFRKDRAHAYFQTESTIQKWRDYFAGSMENTIHENMYAASQGFMLMNPNDTIIVNYLKHNSFVDDGDYAVAFNQKFDRIFARDNNGILKEFDASFLLDTTYTPYIVEDSSNIMKEFVEENIDKEIGRFALYETLFGHKHYSKDQILFEAKAKKYKDYYKMLQDTDEYIAKNTQPNPDMFIAPIGEAYFEEANADCQIYACFAGTGKRFATDYFKKKGLRVNSIEKFKDFDKSKFVETVNDLASKSDILFIPYYLGMEKNDIKGKFKYTLIYPKKELKDMYMKRFIELGFTVDQIKNLSDNWNAMISECRSTKGSVSLGPTEYVTDVINRSFSESVVYDDEISEPWYIISDDGAVNCCISVSGYEHCMRGRSSMLCLNNDNGVWKVFIKRTTDDYGAPGGGWNKDEDPMDAAIREAREEARLEVTNVKRMGTLIEYHENVQDWVKEHVKNEKDWWYGYYSAVFVGKYAGKYTGDIKEEDMDSMGYEGEWVEIEEAAKGLPKEYYTAIIKYLEEEDRNNG